MKSFALFAVLLFCVDLSLQLPELINCTPDFLPPDSMADTCGIFTCHGTNKIVGMGCAIYQCIKKPMGHNEQNNTKRFPHCCGGPICPDQTHTNNLNETDDS